MSAPRQNLNKPDVTETLRPRSKGNQSREGGGASQCACKVLSLDEYGSVSVGHVMQEQQSSEAVRQTIENLLRDPVLVRLLQRSNLTKTQFETVVLDQIGSELANKSLTREEMGELRTPGQKISRGAFNRSLSQARTNIAESVYTVLVLGYCGLLDSPSLAPLVEASERLRSQTERLREVSHGDEASYTSLVEPLLEDLERATESLHGRERDS